MADESLDFFMNHLVDSIYGGSYLSVSRDGSMAVNTEKGNEGKAGYHEIDLAYSAYLYGTLVWKREPVSLYYSFKPGAQARDVRLYPLALKDEDLIITEVTLDGEPFPDFDRKNRTLSLAAGVGGKFKVTYEYTGFSGAVEDRADQVSSGFELYQNYPNPFNPVTTIAFYTSRRCRVDLNVYDSLGKEVAVIMSRTLDRGFHTCPFDASGLKCGVYVYRLEAENFTRARKFVLIK
jgi:hypothetical protein